MSDLRIMQPQTEADLIWRTDLWREEWGGEIMVTRGQSYLVQDLSALIAWDGAQRVGLATYFIHGDSCELMSLNALARGQGIGTAGYRLVAVHPGAIDEARKIKPTIPLTGFYEIPIHDEWELSKTL